LIETIAEFQQ